MRRSLAIAAVACQVLALAYIAGEREWILRTGRKVWLRTAPVDPRDVMRGDYARLDYEIARVNRSLWRDGLATPQEITGSRSPEMRVYASLRLLPDGVAEVTALSDKRPKDGLFLRGRLGSETWWSPTVRYGIEAFFMEQGQAQELENARWRDRPGVPLTMQVAIGANGVGVLKGYRWESLGITLAFDTARRTNRQAGSTQAQNVILGATVALKNHGPQPVAIVDLPGGRSFGLECDARWQAAAYRWLGETNAVPAPEPRDVIVLQPGQSHTSHLDLTQPEWFVGDIRTNATTHLPTPVQQLTSDWDIGFRIQYRPPPTEACARLPNAKLIWHGRLRSRWFNPTGNVD
jgi:uncharacterized membrane-anchored protein